MIFMCKPSASVLVPLGVRSGARAGTPYFISVIVLHIGHTPYIVLSVPDMKEDVSDKSWGPRRCRAVARSRRKENGADFNLSSGKCPNHSRNEPTASPPLALAIAHILITLRYRVLDSLGSARRRRLRLSFSAPFRSRLSPPPERTRTHRFNQQFQ